MTGRVLRQPARIGQCRLTRFRAPRPPYSAMSWPTTRRCTGPFSMSLRHRSANSACICAPTTCSPKRLGQAAPPTPETVQQALGQLVDWGNLQSQPDTARVATIEDFNRKRLLYRMTSGGDAVEA